MLTLISSIGNIWCSNHSTGFPGGSNGNLPAIQETQVRSLGQEDALEKEMATHSSILAWRIPWTEEPGGLTMRGHNELDTTEQLILSAFNHS